jgi:hypothetical protein
MNHFTPLARMGKRWSISGLPVWSASHLRHAGAAAGPKKYFLTPNDYPTHEAGVTCGKGFHMASLFEILDPTQLSYDTKRAT